MVKIRGRRTMSPLAVILTDVTIVLWGVAVGGAVLIALITSAPATSTVGRTLTITTGFFVLLAMPAVAASIGLYFARRRK
jgi:MFS family permease